MDEPNRKKTRVIMKNGNEYSVEHNPIDIEFAHMTDETFIHLKPFFLAGSPVVPRPYRLKISEISEII